VVKSRLIRSLAIPVVAGLLLLIQQLLMGQQANAFIEMGSGNHFEDAQVGLDYVVFEPVFTAGLALKNFTLIPCGNNHDEALSARYGSGKKIFTLIETSSTYKCHLPAITIIAGGVSTSATKPGAGMLTGTSLRVISRGLSNSEITLLMKKLKPKFTLAQ
jgi:hypothetical protein